MRKLQTKDAFNALRVIKKADLKEDIKPLLKMASTKGVNVEDIGIEGVLTVIETLTEKKAENCFYEVLSGPFESEPKEIEAMELNTLIEKLQVLAKENNLKAFFTSLVGMIGKK